MFIYKHEFSDILYVAFLKYLLLGRFLVNSLLPIPSTFQIDCNRDCYHGNGRTQRGDLKGRYPRRGSRMYDTSDISIENSQQAKASNIKDIGNRCRGFHAPAGQGVQ